MFNILTGKRVACIIGGVVFERDYFFQYAPWDRSWKCPVCPERHCSSCFYTTDGETILVVGCCKEGGVFYDCENR